MTDKRNKQCAIPSVIASYSYDEKETKALGWFGFLTNRQKSEYAQSYYNKLHIELTPKEKIHIWENKAWGNWL